MCMRYNQINDQLLQLQEVNTLILLQNVPDHELLVKKDQQMQSLLHEKKLHVSLNLLQLLYYSIQIQASSPSMDTSVFYFRSSWFFLLKLLVEHHDQRQDHYYGLQAQSLDVRVDAE